MCVLWMHSAAAKHSLPFDVCVRFSLAAVQSHRQVFPFPMANQLHPPFGKNKWPDIIHNITAAECKRAAVGMSAINNRKTSKAHTNARQSCVCVVATSTARPERAGRMDRRVVGAEAQPYEVRKIKRFSHFRLSITGATSAAARSDYFISPPGKEKDRRRGLRRKSAVWRCGQRSL
ncbi:polysaccharide deacetylase [Anopheles sinensis]|uniref:Polysaccharide deacetylase n=1 Tax=Anopheles sinensis TaxID=74873 RepID=A0A084WLN3_ANOSI|nr:polysaccharide deacetylase [Anopheles sinensis]